MNELREIFDFGELQIITEKTKLPKYALAKLSYSFARADSENSNKRTYPESILSREINRKSEELRTKKIAGQLEHPLSGITRLDKVAHVLNAVWYDRRTKLAGAESFILDTGKGRDFMTLLDAELKMGVSMRGFGNLKNGKICSDYRFDTVDFVLHPSFGSDATIDQSNIIESANSIFDEKDNKDLMMGLTESYVEKMIESIYSMQIDEGSFSGSLEDFKKQKSNLVKAEILCAHDHFEDVETALKHLGADEEAKRISSAAPVQKRVTLADCYFEATMAGIPPQKYCDRINAKIDRQEALGSEPDFTAEEVRSILEEARISGIDVTEPEERKRILNLAREQKKQPKVLTEEKAFIQFAVREGLNERTAKKLWEEKQKEKKKSAKIAFRIKEEIQSGFGDEARLNVRKISKKILEGE